MSRVIRPHIPGATIFFTVCLARSGADTLIAEITTLRRVVADVRTARPFAIRAFVVLPDHLHAIWTLPEDDCDYSGRWRAIKAGFSRALGFCAPQGKSQSLKGESGLWQRRFWDHRIYSPADLDGHLRYCWSDPVRHGLVRRAADWPFSSLQREIAAGYIPADWPGHAPHGRFGERPSLAMAPGMIARAA